MAARIAEKILRVIHPRLLRPIRLENLLLHPRAVEAAVRETIDRENVSVRFLQPLLEFGESVAFQQLPRRHRRETQPDGESLVRSQRPSVPQPIPDCQHVRVQHRECLRPGLRGVDVRAVGKVGVVEFQRRGELVSAA
jgi:hypothetical protein